MRVVLFVGVTKKRLTGYYIAADNLRRGLEKLGHKVILVCPSSQGEERETPYSYRSPLGVWALPDIIDPTVFKEIDKFKPDIVHSHGADLVCLAGIKYAFEKNIPIVYTAHNEFRAFLKSVFPWYLRYFMAPIVMRWIKLYINLCDVVIALNKNIEEYLKREKIKPRVVVQPTGTDLEQFLYKPRTKISKPCKILCVSSADKRKNVKLLVDMMRYLDKNEYKLLLIGEGGEDNHVKKLAKRLGIENVDFIGRVPHEEIHKYYRDADIFTLPSSIEAQPLVYVEAMAAALPIITLRNLGSLHAVKNGKTGLIMKRANARLFSEAVQKVTGNLALYKGMSKEAIKRSRKFDVVETSKKTVAIYEETIKTYREVHDKAKKALVNRIFDKLKRIFNSRLVTL
ncbi:glycosyltransferase [Candidatus Dojkabacteria bacterium]|nr:glycosyltransferase [Candidatus Dojkabacteria bacterium]